MKKILVAIDDSPRARMVLDAGVSWARSAGAKIIVFRACPLPPHFPPQTFAMGPDMLPQFLIENAREQLTEQTAHVPGDLLLGLRVELGSAWQQICDVARTENADLIVLGTHGYSLLERMIGTTAARVANHADRSVLLVYTRDSSGPKSAGQQSNE